MLRTGYANVQTVAIVIVTGRTDLETLREGLAANV